jgi:hypothetical protein
MAAWVVQMAACAIHMTAWVVHVTAWAVHVTACAAHMASWMAPAVEGRTPNAPPAGAGGVLLGPGAPGDRGSGPCPLDWEARPAGPRGVAHHWHGGAGG